MRFGIQMYGVNEIFLQDKEAFLKRITKAGYRFLEPCTVLDENPFFATKAWMDKDFEENMPLLKKYGVSVYSCFLFTNQLTADLDRVIAFANKYEIRQIILPCPGYQDMEQYQAVAKELSDAGKRLSEHGVELLIHNGTDTSTDRINGVCAFEWLLQACGESVGAQPDTGYFLQGDVDPEEFLWRNKKQIRSLHYKDMEKTENGITETGVGRGLTDMMACFQFARAAEIIQLVDQDGSKGDFMDDLDYAAGLFRQLGQGRDRSRSILCTMDIKTGEVKKLHTFDGVIEAPNWMQNDADYLIYNADGLIWKYQISEDKITPVNSGYCTNCNNDHVLSPDNKELAVSHSEPNCYSQIFIFPLEGAFTEPKLITELAPSYLHGWSSDGKELAYCAFRDHGNGMDVDIHAISRDGGEEWRLTNTGFNDGPEYAPNNEDIWFTSTRTGLMQIWKMKRDGSEQTQVVCSDRNDWFPHVSPDSQKVVYLSYSKEGLDPTEHLPNMDVELHLMNYDGSDDHTILKFFGGQGSINVNSWNPDSKQFAFVMYELEHK